MPTTKGACFCGEIQIELAGEPVAMGYCHCNSCRTWSASPLNAFTLWKPDALRVTTGAGSLREFAKTPNSIRQWCSKCGGHVFTEHPGMGLIDVYAATIPSHAFAPALHVNYQETVLRIHDGRPKMKDMPKEMGGSGVVLDE